VATNPEYPDGHVSGCTSEGAVGDAVGGKVGDVVSAKVGDVVGGTVGAELDWIGEQEPQDLGHASRAEG